MLQHFAVPRLLAVLFIFVFVFALTLASAAFAQETQYPEILDARPMYKAGPNHVELTSPLPAAASLKQWRGSFTDLTKKKINYTMVGTDPSKGSVTTTTPVYLIPIKMVYGKTNGNHTFDPVTKKVSKGRTVVNNVIASPVFAKGLNFTQGGTDVGTTQYTDAFQRANFWQSVHLKANSGYHVLLGHPIVLKEQTITVPKSLGGVFNNPFGTGIVGTYDMTAFDKKLQAFMKSFSQINPGVLPLFITYNIYLTNGACCIGGYHNANGLHPSGQTYSYATYVDSHGAFAQDVSALSDEIGEWMDDPFVDNKVNCQGNDILEVGDPLENSGNYGAYPYTLGGFKYNLQSLVFIGYFGAPRSTSLHSWLAFQNDEAHICPGQ
jgi:hypothetical protein